MSDFPFILSKCTNQVTQLTSLVTFLSLISAGSCWMGSSFKSESTCYYFVTFLLSVVCLFFSFCEGDGAITEKLTF